LQRNTFGCKCEGNDCYCPENFAVNLGKSRVNFALAETGIFNLEENEGNDRFSTTLSPVHVAVMGNFDFTSFNNY